jgi:hypothetical protein
MWLVVGCRQKTWNNFAKQVVVRRECIQLVGPTMTILSVIPLGVSMVLGHAGDLLTLFHCEQSGFKDIMCGRNDLHIKILVAFGMEPCGSNPAGLISPFLCKHASSIEYIAQEP